MPGFKTLSRAMIIWGIMPGELHLRSPSTGSLCLTRRKFRSAVRWMIGCRQIRCCIKRRSRSSPRVRFLFPSTYKYSVAYRCRVQAVHRRTGIPSLKENNLATSSSSTFLPSATPSQPSTNMTPTSWTVAALPPASSMSVRYVIPTCSTTPHLIVVALCSYDSLG